MTQWIIRPNELIEPAPAPEFYIDGCGAIEQFGSCVRLHLYSQQMPLECAGETSQKIVMVKIVRPVATLPKAMLQIAQCLWPDAEEACRNCPVPSNGKPRLVR